MFEPEEITKDTAVFLVHGGGWRGGGRTKFHEIMEEFNDIIKLPLGQLSSCR